MDDRGSQHCSHSIALCSIAGKASLRVIMTTMQTSCMACKHASTLTPCLCSLRAWSCRYLSPEVNQCEGIDLPFVHDKGLFTPKRWTVTVDSATVYAAYAQAYIPPLSDFVSTASVQSTSAAYYQHTNGHKPTCGVSFAFVGHGKLYHQEGLLAGTADVTSEYLWCAGGDLGLGGYQSDSGVTIGFTGDSSNYTMCLPYLTLSPAGNDAGSPPDRAGAPAPASASGFVRTASVSVAAGANIMAGAEIMSVAMQRLRASQQPGQETGHSATVCDLSDVAFANPGAVQIHVDLASTRRRYEGYMQATRDPGGYEAIQPWPAGLKQRLNY